MFVNSLRLLKMSLLNAKNHSSQSVKNLLQLTKTDGKSFSVELLPSPSLRLDQLPVFHVTFYSVIWRQTEETPVKSPKDLPAIVVSKKLIEKGYPVLLHLAGRYLKENETLGILNEAKDIGVRDIFALKGGKAVRN